MLIRSYRCVFIALTVCGVRLAPLSAEDAPGLPGVIVAIVHTQDQIEGVAQRNMLRFKSVLKRTYQTKVLPDAAVPESVLKEHPEVSVVIGGTFEVAERGVLADIYWRPDGKAWQPEAREPVPTSLDASDPVEGAALETNTFLREKLYASLRLHLAVIKQSKIADQILKATDLTHQRKFDEALKIAERLLKARLDDGQKYRVRYLLGFCYKKQGKLKDAADQFELAQKLNPESDSAYFERGNVEFLRGHLDQAEAIFGDVRDRGEANAHKARWNLALVYQSQGAWDKALAELDALPTNSVHEFNRNSLRKSLRDAQAKAAAALKRAEDAEHGRAQDRQDRTDLFRRLMIGLVVAGVFVVAGLIYVLYRRLQQTPELSAHERADYTGKVMGGLFNMLSLLGGAMLGALLTR